MAAAHMFIPFSEYATTPVSGAARGAVYAGSVCVKQATALLGGATGLLQVLGQPLAVSVPLNLPVVVLYVSVRDTYRLPTPVHVLANAVHVDTAVPLVS